MIKPKRICFLLLIVMAFHSAIVKGQSFGPVSSAVWLTNCSQSNFFNTSGAGGNLIGPVANTFSNTNLGVYTQNSATLILRGAQVRTFKNPASSNVCSVKMYYRVYLQTGTPGAFANMDIPFAENCSGSNTYGSGETCQPGDQKWQRIVADGTTSPYSPVNLTAYPAGDYVLEVYYELTGSLVSTSLCNDIITLNNGGNNYKAFFSIQSPSLSSTNPSSCNGTEGTITINNLSPNAVYKLSYTDDGVATGPLTLTANAGGQVTITGLNSGLYSSFQLMINSCSTNLNTGILLTNPIYLPLFDPVPPFCAGTPPPVLPTTSLNGITGSWSPAVVDNQNSGTYTFSSASQCGLPVTLTVTVIPRKIPVFSFGAGVSICPGEPVPLLTSPSTNGITGTWSPAIVDNQHAGTYTFTPDPNQCADGTTFTVTLKPPIVPQFSFGNSSSGCIQGAAPLLPNVSNNGITGSWSPAVVDNLSDGSYLFTPNTGQCATTTTFTYTVDVVPTFTYIRADTTVYDGAAIPGFHFNQSAGAVVHWTNTNPAIGLAGAGDGDMPSFTATNMTTSPVTGTVTAMPYINGCVGETKSYTVTVLPISKDLFVPNVFSPNGDGKNDILYVYGNYIQKLEMHIFNQWGQEVIVINDKSRGWDGRFRGTPQPVGVYMYVLKAELTTGKPITLKGSITLVR
jgi:large repetitive protein